MPKLCKFLPLAATALLGACVTTTSPAPTHAPSPNGARPAITADCTGPSAKNFNGARLTRDITASIPQQFAQDREILTRILQGKGDMADREFAKLCHGLTLPE